MKRGSFRKQNMSEIIKKQAIKRAKKLTTPTAKRLKLTSKPLKAKKATKGRSKVKSLAKWKKELDAIFSKWIRQRDQGQCFTCPKKDDPKNMQNGHFVPRQYLAVRYDERNCNCQCYACNMLYGGQGATYAIRLAQKYGQSVVEELEAQRWVTTKLDESYYRTQIEKYKQLLL